MFGYDIEADLESTELLESAKFLAHAVYLIEMFITALHMLGSDGTLLITSLKELGNKHIKYGAVQAEMFPVMRQALFFTLKNQLGDVFTNDVEQSWKVVYGALSQDMMSTVMGAHKQ
jgi:hemoglobin-like flavoprotein